MTMKADHNKKAESTEKKALWMKPTMARLDVLKNTLDSAGSTADGGVNQS